MQKYIWNVTNSLIIAFGVGAIVSSSLTFVPADEPFEVIVTPDVGAAPPEYNAVGAALEILGILTWTFDEGTGEVVTPNQNQANLWLEPVYVNDKTVHYFDVDGVLIPYTSLSSGQQATAFLKHLVGHMAAQRRGMYVPEEVSSARATAEAQVATDAEMFEEF